jgi:hypothetical protein
MPLEDGRADERVSRGQASERALCVYEAVSVEKGARRPPLPTAVVCPPGRRRRRRLAITAVSSEPSVPAFDACSQRWLWQYHTRSVQCFAAAALASCSLAQPACFRKALRTLFVHTERTVVLPFRTSNVIRLVRSSHLLSSSEISRPSSARVSARSLISSPRCDFTFIRNVALPAQTRCLSRQTISRRISASGAVANVAFPPCPTHFLITHKTADSRTFARSFLPEFAAPGPHLSIFARPIHTQCHSLKSTLTAKHRHGLRAFDCTAAYLQAELKKPLYARPPKGLMSVLQKEMGGLGTNASDV